MLLVRRSHFTGDDVQLLDTLGKASAIQLRLVRSMTTGSEATDDVGTSRTNTILFNTSGKHTWHSKEGAEEANKRVLEGEMELVRTLNPSFKFPKYYNPGE